MTTRKRNGASVTRKNTKCKHNIIDVMQISTIFGLKHGHFVACPALVILNVTHSDAIFLFHLSESRGAGLSILHFFMSKHIRLYLCCENI